MTEIYLRVKMVRPPWDVLSRRARPGWLLSYLPMVAALKNWSVYHACPLTLKLFENTYNSYMVFKPNFDLLFFLMKTFWFFVRFSIPRIIIFASIIIIWKWTEKKSFMVTQWPGSQKSFVISMLFSSKKWNTLV